MSTQFKCHLLRRLDKEAWELNVLLKLFLVYPQMTVIYSNVAQK